MKNIIKGISVLAVILLTFSACSNQSDESSEIEDTAVKLELTQTITKITKNIVIANSLKNLSLDLDLLQDGCFAVAYPVSVENGSGEKATVSSNEELEGLIDRLIALDSDIKIEYPISLTYGDSKTLTITTNEMLYAAVESCVGDINENCFALIYPIEVNKNKNTDGNISIGDDMELLAFVADFSISDYIEVIYPVNVVLEDGTAVEISDDQTFLALADSCIDN